MNQQNKYWPLISSANRLREYTLNDHQALLLGDIESTGRVQYHFVLLVYDPAGEICFAVTSERNTFADPEKTPSYFLGVFRGYLRENRGKSVDWGDLETFAKRALEIAKESLQIEEISS